MNSRQISARILIGLGSLDIAVGAALHWAAGYPRVASALAASNLDPAFSGAMRAVFLMIGCMWIVLAAVILIAAFAKAGNRKTIVVFCGFALLAQIPIWVRLMGWFIGNEMFFVAGVLIACGGLVLPSLSNAQPGRQIPA